MPVLYDAPGRHRHITVIEDTTTRYLLLDGEEEGAMALASEEPVFDYLWFHRASVLAAGPVRRALVLGAGAFTAARCLALDYPAARVDVVDAEPELGPVGRQFFRLDRPEFAGVVFHGTPAEDFLRGAGPAYDFIFDDVFDGFHHVPESCRDADYYRCLHDRLEVG